MMKMMAVMNIIMIMLVLMRLKIIMVMKPDNNDDDDSHIFTDTVSGIQLIAIGGLEQSSPLACDQ